MAFRSPRGMWGKCRLVFGCILPLANIFHKGFCFFHEESRRSTGQCPAVSPKDETKNHGKSSTIQDFSKLRPSPLSSSVCSSKKRLNQPMHRRKQSLKTARKTKSTIMMKLLYMEVCKQFTRVCERKKQRHMTVCSGSAHNIYCKRVNLKSTRKSLTRVASAGVRHQVERLRELHRRIVFDSQITCVKARISILYSNL